MIKHAFLVAAVSCLTALPALAMENVTESEKRFRSLDENNNNFVSLYEARDKHRVFNYYQIADKNEDGHLDMQEFIVFESQVPDYGME